VTIEELELYAKQNLWMCFTKHAQYDQGEEIPIIVRGEGAYVFDQHGKRIFDGLASLFTCQIGHGRRELGEAALKQAELLEFFPLWTYGHPAAIELAHKLSGYAPGDLNRVFFTSSGGESVESAWKLAKQYFKLRGKPMKHKVISRYLAYHGTTMGALSITGIPVAKQWFEPLVPSTIRVPNANFYRAPDYVAHDEVAFGQWAANQIEQAIIMEGPDTIAAVFLEPVQNVGGCFPSPPGYLERVREICTQYDVLMVADETITGFGRIGEMFAINRYNVVPDIITCAKGLSSGYAPIGAVIASEGIFETFNQTDNMFTHGFTYSGHAVSAAIALANLEIMENENLCGYVRENEAAFHSILKRLLDIPIVGDVRGAGFFYGIELVKNQATKESFSDEESERILKNFISRELLKEGLYCRADDRGEPVVQLSPPLITTISQMEDVEGILRKVLTKAASMV
jgi:adenosylmethionine-8-amino-7-oxononanoate aminotransferase